MKKKSLLLKNYSLHSLERPEHEVGEEVAGQQVPAPAPEVPQRRRRPGGAEDRRDGDANHVPELPIRGLDVSCLSDVSTVIVIHRATQSRLAYFLGLAQTQNRSTMRKHRLGTLSVNTDPEFPETL